MPGRELGLQFVGADQQLAGSPIPTMSTMLLSSLVMAGWLGLGHLRLIQVLALQTSAAGGLQY